ncbi:MAG: GNAT family N-acetyltransferase [Saprospirales bacterium]|nr:GNAT family N-acetyltransferase [Saprospirales bacterium]
MLLEIRKYNEFELTKDVQEQIALLLKKCFPDTTYNGRHYFKQLPHFRFLAYEDDMLVGHVAIDYRMMRLNDTPIKVVGVIELCVLEERRNHYIGGFLLEEVEKLAKTQMQILYFCFQKLAPSIKSMALSM